MWNVLVVTATLLPPALLPTEVLASPTQAASLKCPYPQIHHIAIHSPLFFSNSRDRTMWAKDGSDGATESVVATVYLTDAPGGDNDPAGSSANHLRLKPATIHNDLTKRSPQYTPPIPTLWELGRFAVCVVPRCLLQYLVKGAYNYCGPWLGLSISIKRDDEFGSLVLGDLQLHPELWTARYEPVRPGVGMNVVAILQYLKQGLRHMEIYDIQTARSIMDHPQVGFENPEEVPFHISVTHLGQEAG